MNKNLILCADDYAQNLAISEGILLLAKKNKINAISCLVNTPLWREVSKELAGLNTTTYLGLHFNLTMGDAVSMQWQHQHGQKFTGLWQLLKRSYLHQLDFEAIDAEINAQIGAFTQAIGRAPDFIDGHQHVHQLPMIRDRLINLYQKNKWRFYIRSTCGGLSDMLSFQCLPKRSLILLLGGITFKSQLKQTAIPTNTSFEGIYHFKENLNYGEYFKHFLRQSDDGGIIMCHPGLPSSDESDPLYRNRCHELNYFMSHQFEVDLLSHSFQLCLKQSKK